MMIQSTQLCDSPVPAALFMAIQPQSCLITIIPNPADCFMRNKPNFPEAAIFLTFYSKKDYENEPRPQTPEKQTQFIAA
jgi:hypothetical protein